MDNVDRHCWIVMNVDLKKLRGACKCTQLLDAARADGGYTKHRAERVRCLRKCQLSLMVE